MKKTFTLLFVGSMLTVSACQSKPKTEKAATDTTVLITTDTAVIATDSSTAVMTESDTTVVPDSVKK